MTILDFKSLTPNTNFNALLFLIKETKILMKKDNNLYISTTLENKTGTIQAVYWGPVDDDVKAAFKTGNILSLSGSVKTYRDRNQITINRYEEIDTKSVDTSELIKEAPYKGDLMYRIVETHTVEFENLDYKAIVTAFLEKYKELIRTHPAAKRIHHGYKGGLLYHTCSILTTAKSVEALHGDYLDKDLLRAGIILHDLGKLTEYTSYIGTEITLEGRLKGHISIMSEEIGKMAEKLDIKDPTNVLKLQHMILSHHGPVENGWGSTVSPQLIEAHILHKLDSLDAEMDAYKNAMDQTELNTFSAPIFGINNSKFYKHTDYNQ